MGLFSSKKKTQVATSISRVLEDSSLPNSILTGVTKSLFNGDNQPIENVIEDLSNGIGLKANRMYEYGRNTYSFGLPSSNIHSSVDAESIVIDTVEGIEGGTIASEYYHFGPLNNLHVGWMKLVDQYGYVSSSNQISSLTASKGFPVYLKDIVVVVTTATAEELNDGSLKQFGVSPAAGKLPSQAIETGALVNLRKHTPPEIDPNAVEDHVRVSVLWIVPTEVIVENVPIMKDIIHEEQFTIPLGDYDEEADYHHLSYTIDGNRQYWLYKDQCGDFPLVDAVFKTTHNPLGSFFPFGYFRYNKVSMGVDKTSQEYKTSEKLMSYIGLDYASVIDSIHENPDIGQVDQAMLMMSVPASTENPMEQRYLFDFFKSMYTAYAGGGRSGSKLSQFLESILGHTIPARSITIQDKRFKMALSFSTMVRQKVRGVIGKVGSYSSEYIVENVQDVSVKIGNGNGVQVTVGQGCHSYKHQITDVLYEELKVYGLKMTYFIYENYTTVGDETSDILLIPIDKSITQHYSIPDREVLYARSLHYVFNSRVITTVKWYQTGFFKILMIIVTIAIMIYTYGSTIEATLAALAAGTVTLTAVIISVVIEIVKNLVISMIIKLFVKAVGIKIAFIVAVIAAITGTYIALENGSVAGAPWASELLQVANGLAKGISNNLKDAYTGLKHEAEEFEQFVESEEKRLKEANDLLNNDNILAPLIVFGESPDDFYARTVHSGNIGVLGLDVITNFVDVQLTLPKLTDTLQEA